MDKRQPDGLLTGQDTEVANMYAANNYGAPPSVAAPHHDTIASGGPVGPNGAYEQYKGTTKPATDSYPAPLGCFSKVLRVFFVFTNAMSVLGYFLSWCSRLLTFSWFVLALCFQFVAVILMVVHTEARCVAAFNEKYPYLRSKWFSVGYGGFLVIVYPYPPRMINVEPIQAIFGGGVVMLINMFPLVFLFLYGIIGMCMKPKAKIYM